MVDYFALATGITRQHAAAIREIPVTDRLASIVVHLAEAHRQLGILYGERHELTSRVYAAWSDAEARLTQAEKDGEGYRHDAEVLLTQEEKEVAA